MIISVEEAKENIGFKNWTDEKIERKLKAIEQTVRSYTNNNFQNRFIRSGCAVIAQKIYGKVPGLTVGDTIQISESRFNNGLFVVTAIEGNLIAVDNGLIDESHILVTKIEYPDDVIDCALNLMEWEVNNRGKVGIKSETLSRHSVTYFDQDANNQVMGYPVSLLGCLKPYRKARC